MRNPVSEPLCVGLVGVGRWGRNLVNTTKQIPGLRLVAVCDQDPDALAQALPLLPFPCAIYSDLNSLLADSKVKALLVATPAESHASIALAALALGLSVFVEKPLSNRIDTAASVERAAAGRVMVGHLLVFHPAIELISSLIAARSFGPTVDMNVERLSLSRIDAPCPWWNLGAHDLALAIRWFGVPSRLRVRSGSTVEACIEFGSRARVNAVLCAASSHKRRHITLRGANGFARFDDLAEEKLVIDLGGDRFVPCLDQTPPLTRELAHFASALTQSTPFICDASEGRRVVELLQLGQTSMLRGGAWVSIGTSSTQIGKVVARADSESQPLQGEPAL